ncbi:MAG: SH3 domain-containing protein [Sulfurimonas sp.]
MAIKKISTGIILMSLMMPSLSSASDFIVVDDVAKALEIVITDMKKQKEEFQKKDLSIETLKADIASLKEQITQIRDQKSQSVSKTASDSNQSVIIKRPELANKSVQLFKVESLTAIVKKYSTVTASSLCVRKSPSTEAPVIGGLPKGSIVEVIDLKNDFTRTGLGWVSSAYLKPIEGN